MRVRIHTLFLVACLGGAALSYAQTSVAPIDFENVPDGTSPDAAYAGVTLIGGSVLTSGVTLNEADFPPRSGSKVWADTGGPLAARFTDPVSTVSVAVTSSQRVVAVMFSPGSATPNEMLILDAATGANAVPRAMTAQLTIPGRTIERVLFRGTAAGGSFTLDDLAFSVSPRAPGINNLSIQPVRLRFEFSIGGQVPASQRIFVDSSESSAVTVTSSAAWLRASAERFQSPGEVGVSIVPAGLAAGSYSATLTFRNSVSSQQLFVNLTVLNPPELFALPTMLSFTQRVGGARPSAQTVFVGSRNSNLVFSIAPQESWISATQTGPQTPANMGVTVDAGNRPPGIYEGSLILTPQSSTQTPLIVRVRLEVVP